MSVEATTSTADKAKLLLAFGLVAAAIVAFYFFPEQSLLLRVVGLLVVTGIAVAIAMQTALGRSTWTFMQGARTEVRKVVWPTRKETLQMALIVFVMVVIMALVLWSFDSLLSWVIKLLIGGGN